MVTIIVPFPQFHYSVFWCPRIILQNMITVATHVLPLRAWCDLGSRSLRLLLLMLPGACALFNPAPPIITFQDALMPGLLGPVMVKIPAGSFYMGSPQQEPGRDANESPQHLVVFQAPFALGQTEVTVAQFGAFVTDTHYRTSAERDDGSFLRDPVTGQWGKYPVNWRHDHRGQPAADNHPVIHVSWEDAQAYASWLTQRTGQPYRLPSEAELEYANRAGSPLRNWWGDGIPQAAVANIKGERDRIDNDPTFIPTPEERAAIDPEGIWPEFFIGYGDGHWGPAPVASFQANAFGLYDTTGNVWEWAQDCWHPDYRNAPSDGKAWIENGICEYRILRGASWYCYPVQVRAANRWSRWPIFRNMYIGFRVARNVGA